ncbi:MAG TPA: hypothetical protein VG034_12415 [Acidimicrobiia bacterium]|nr:hypothetical protein [Acidimicrobiia bacterium]
MVEGQHEGGRWRLAARALARPGQYPIRLWYARMLLDRRGPRDQDRAIQLLTEASEGYGRLGMSRHQDMAARYR